MYSASVWERAGSRALIKSARASLGSFTASKAP